MNGQIVILFCLAILACLELQRSAIRDENLLRELGVIP